jgi:hypothetical protein
MTTVISVLQSELAYLEAELSRDARYKKITKIKELLAMYAAAPAEDIAVLRAAARAQAEPSVNAVSRFHPRGNPNSLTTKILEAAGTYLEQKGTRAETAEVTDACIDAGVPLRGDIQKQRDYVSSVLSHSSAIDNVTGQGYGLVEWSQNLRITETPDSSELSGDPWSNGAMPLNT